MSTAMNKNDEIPVSEFVPADRSKIDMEQIVRPSVSYWQGVWRKFREDRLGQFCVILILAVILMAIFAPMLSPYRYDKTSLLESNLSPSAQHWFGTDSVGRDIWTRVWVGARVSLAVGFIGAIIPFALGMAIGSISGWCGGWVDMIIMRIIDVGLCIPSMIYLILVIVYFGGRPRPAVQEQGIHAGCRNAGGFIQPDHLPAYSSECARQHDRLSDQFRSGRDVHRSKSCVHRPRHCPADDFARPARCRRRKSVPDSFLPVHSAFLCSGPDHLRILHARQLPAR